MIRVILVAGIALLLVIVVFAWSQRSRFRRREIHGGGAMALDPVCLTYIPEARALKLRIKGVDYAFCSRECAEAFPRLAAAQPSDPHSSTARVDS